MALKTKKILPSNVEATYFRIVQQNMNYDRLDCVVTLAGYISQAARDEGAEPVCSCTIDLAETFHGAENKSDDVMGDCNRATLYNLIKKQATAQEEEVEGEETTAKNADLQLFAKATDI
jgi:hypothetical protein